VLLHSERLRREGSERATILVICPLRNLILDQLDEAKDLGIPATSSSFFRIDKRRMGNCILGARTCPQGRLSSMFKRK